MRNVERAFECRLGRRRANDTIPRKEFGKPISRGTAKGKYGVTEAQLEQLKDEYYTLRGWDLETGVPTRCDAGGLRARRHRRRPRPPGHPAGVASDARLPWPAEPQQSWRLEIAGYLFLGGVGAGWAIAAAALGWAGARAAAAVGTGAARHPRRRLLRPRRTSDDGPRGAPARPPSGSQPPSRVHGRPQPPHFVAGAGLLVLSGFIAVGCVQLAARRAGARLGRTAAPRPGARSRSPSSSSPPGLRVYTGLLLRSMSLDPRLAALAAHRLVRRVRPVGRHRGARPGRAPRASGHRRVEECGRPDGQRPAASTPLSLPAKALPSSSTSPPCGAAARPAAATARLLLRGRLVARLLDPRRRRGPGDPARRPLCRARRGLGRGRRGRVRRARRRLHPAPRRARGRRKEVPAAAPAGRVAGGRTRVRRPRSPRRRRRSRRAGRHGSWRPDDMRGRVLIVDDALCDGCGDCVTACAARAWTRARLGSRAST